MKLQNGGGKDYIIVSIVAVILFSLLQFSFENLAGNDSYYHVKYAELMRSNGFIKDMKWTYHSILHENFYDMHMMGHIFLIPFTFGENDIFMAKIASVLLSSLVVVVFYWFLRVNKIKYCFLWAGLLIGASPLFLRRLLYVRISIQLSIILSILSPLGAIVMLISYVIFSILGIIIFLYLIYKILIKTQRCTIK